jgi:predicted Zn-dependent protease
MHCGRITVGILYAMTFVVVGAEDVAHARREYAKAVLSAVRNDDAQRISHEEAARIAHPTAGFLVSRSASRALKAGDVKSASTLYRELAKAHPDSLNTQFLYADFLRSQSKNDDFALRLAVETLEGMLPMHQAQPELLERLLRLYEQQGKREKSQALYDAYMKLPQADPAVAAKFSLTLHDIDDEKNRSQLDTMYRNRMEESPRDPILARAASEHFRGTNRLDEAISILEVHTKAAPSSLDLRVRLGILELADKRSEQGEKTLLDVLEIAPSQFLAHQALAKLYTNQEKIEPARHHRAELLKTRGGEIDEFRQLGQAWIEANEARRARLLLEKAVFHHPKDVGLAYLYAIASQRDPETQKTAFALFEAAAKLSTEPITEPLYLLGSAEAYWSAGKAERAESSLRQAIKLYPPDQKKDSAAAMRLLASWWQQQNKNAEAAKALIQRAEMMEK